MSAPLWWRFAPCGASVGSVPPGGAVVAVAVEGIDTWGVEVDTPFGWRVASERFASFDVAASAAEAPGRLTLYRPYRETTQRAQVDPGLFGACPCGVRHA